MFPIFYLIKIWYKLQDKVEKKAVQSLAAVLLLILSLFSINSLIFSVRLFRLSIGTIQKAETENRVLARNFLLNKRLSPLVRDRSHQTDLFLASLVTELIADDEVLRLEREFEELGKTVIDRFPENIFLVHYGLYEEGIADQDWANFDALSLKLLRESRFNSMSFPILTQNIAENKIPDSSLPFLIRYLNWMHNFSLSGDLLSWARKSKKIDDAVYDTLQKDISQRKTSRSAPQESPLERSGDFFFSIPFEKGKVEVEAGSNLLLGKKMRSVSSQTGGWIFTDISDTDQYAKGSFYGDIDRFQNNRLRVMGFFTRYFEGKGFAHGGLQMGKKIGLTEDLYLFHFKYKTSGQSEIPSFWLAYEFEKLQRIAPAESGWKDVFFLFNNAYYKLPFVQPFLRMFGTGSVWFENIGLYKIDPDNFWVEQDALIIQ